MPVFDGSDVAAVRRAAHRLADGELVAFPTETVYGLGARADDDAAVARIFEAKGRPSDHPLIVHVADRVRVDDFAATVGPVARALMEAFWPGPLTLILPRRPGCATAASGGQSSIGLRMPSHPVARALLHEAAALGVGGVAAPSANRFGRVSPTSAAHVVDEFGPDLWVLDGGECEVGIESAIVDCSGAVPALLRPGMLGRAAIEGVIGAPLAAPDRHAPRAPGTLEAHYAPAARVRLMSAAQLRDALSVVEDGEVPAGLAVYSRTVMPRRHALHWRTMPADAAAAAHELFAALRGFDAAGARLLWIEEPPATPEWEGVRDRLRRAAAAS